MVHETEMAEGSSCRGERCHVIDGGLVVLEVRAIVGPLVVLVWPAHQGPVQDVRVLGRAADAVVGPVAGAAERHRAEG